MRMPDRMVLVLMLLATPVVGFAQTRPNYLLFTDPGKRFSIEFPENWRWMIVSPSGEPLATFIDPRSEAAVVVERLRLKQPLAPEDVTELFAEIEAEHIKENQVGVAGVAVRVMMRNDRRTAIVDYTRPGLKEQERVRQFSIPVGQNLYRITCMALASRFERYEADFIGIVETLKAATELKSIAPGGR